MGICQEIGGIFALGEMPDRRAPGIGLGASHRRSKPGAGEAPRLTYPWQRWRMLWPSTM
jgi:hypothetical protein